jgi:hypothetical protein
MPKFNSIKGIKGAFHSLNKKSRLFKDPLKWPSISNLSRILANSKLKKVLLQEGPTDI